MFLDVTSVRFRNTLCDYENVSFIWVLYKKRAFYIQSKAHDCNRCHTLLNMPVRDSSVCEKSAFRVCPLYYLLQI